MSKSAPPSKNAPMVIPATKPRNPFGVGTGMAKAGSHDKPKKVQRQLDKKATREAADKEIYGSPDSFTP